MVKGLERSVVSPRVARRMESMVASALGLGLREERVAVEVGVPRESSSRDEGQSGRGGGGGAGGLERNQGRVSELFKESAALERGAGEEGWDRRKTDEVLTWEGAAADEEKRTVEGDRVPRTAVRRPARRFILSGGEVRRSGSRRSIGAGWHGSR